jgi:hypothetical protein
MYQIPGVQRALSLFGLACGVAIVIWVVIWRPEDPTDVKQWWKIASGSVGYVDARIRENFKKLVAIPQSPERGRLFRFRTKATFHYDRKVSAEHLQRVIASDPTATWSYSVGSTPPDWHFELGDAVMDHMVVKFVLGADEPRSPARSKKVGEIATRLDQIATMFTDFATSFIERHS